MAESIMLDKAKDFAVNIVNLCKFIKETKRESVLTNQLLRSGTSIGANIHESKYAHGTADFIAKLQIALKECYESINQMKNVTDGIWMNAKTGAYVVVENGLLISYDENNIRTQLNKLRNTTLSFDDYCKTFSTDCATKVDYDYTNGHLLDNKTQAFVF